MDFADFELRRQLQEQFNGYFSSESKSGYKFPRNQDWNSSNIILINGSSYNTNVSETISSSTELWSSPTRSTICQEGFIHESANRFPADIKEEESDSFLKHSEMMRSRSSNIDDQEAMLPRSKHHPQCWLDLGGNIWLNNFSFGHDITELQLSAGVRCPFPQKPSSLASEEALCSRFFSQIFPSTTTSASHLCASLVSGSLNLQALGLGNSTYHDGSSSKSSHNINHGTLNASTFLGHEGIQELREHSPSHSSNKMPRLINEVKGTKRPGSFPESKATYQDSRKYRSGSSCPTQKANKREKLGDRIQALQKMVAPFGKTDTASVLTEAIAYIQFLHHQVQTLSMPTINSSDSYTTMQTSSSKEERNRESKRDLRRRGLCIVPLSHASYFSSYSGKPY